MKLFSVGFSTMPSVHFLLFWVSFFFFFFNLIFLSHSSPFFPGSNVTLYGDASFTRNSIFLTQTPSCFSSTSPPTSPFSRPSGVGRAFQVNAIRFLDWANNSSASFISHFSFSIVRKSFCPSGDGIVFLITSNVSSFSLSHGYMGLPEPALNSEDTFFAVEFDTNFNPSLGDINGNHIGIDVNSVTSLSSVDVISKGIDLKSGNSVNAWVEYRHDMKMVRVFVGLSQIRPPNPLLVAQIDLSLHFKEFMHVGFSASNGQGSALHIIHQWWFKTFEIPPSGILLDDEEGDCFMCVSSEDSSFNYGGSASSQRKIRAKEMALGLGGLTAFSCSVFAILVVIVVFLLKRRKQIIRRNTRETLACEFQMNKVPSRLSLAEIRTATMGFNRSRIVGEGGSATVYKGSLQNGREVAVKRFERTSSNSNDRIRNPFSTEFSTMADCLRHKNLVQLHGWCCEGSELVLVYEYLPNGSLDKILHRNSDPQFVLSWKQRLKIVLGVASALTYLHEQCESQVIHRDVKSCNIMLDEEFNPKLGDFGLAEVYQHSSIDREATVPAGTIGYLAPEYVFSGILSVKTDVYSFGVVVLEVTSGRKPVEDDGTVLVDQIWKLWERGRLMEGADPRLKKKYDAMEMERMLIVGLSCVNPNHEKRPTMKEAAKILRCESPLPVLPSRKPRMRIRSVDADDRLEESGERPSLDDAQWMTPRSHFSQK